MLVERNLKVMNVAVIGDAYAIASYYLRKSGQITDTAHTNDALLKSIIMMVHCGEKNKIWLANKAIMQFEVGLPGRVSSARKRVAISQTQS